MEKKILIGGAWPYANGSLHIGIETSDISKNYSNIL